MRRWSSTGSLQGSNYATPNTYTVNGDVVGDTTSRWAGCKIVFCVVAVLVVLWLLAVERVQALRRGEGRHLPEPVTRMRP